MEYLTVSHEELMVSHREQAALIARLEATVAQLAARVQELEGRAGSPRGMPGHKPAQEAPPPTTARRKRSLACTRRRATPTTQIEHALPVCPHCGAPLAGGSIKRRREVLEIAPQPLIVTEHVYLERCCGDCHRRSTPTVALAGVVAGQSRLGVGLVSLIAVLREELRLPVAAIRRYLASVHGCRLSDGGIIGALGQVAQAGQAELARMLVAIRASPVVHVDETGWREAGGNGYIWTCSTPTDCLFTHGGRGTPMFEATMAGAVGTLVTDFYAVYDRYPGVQQKCWAHLWRDIRELERQHPADERLAAWIVEVGDIYREATAFSHAEEGARLAQRRAVQVRLLAACQPFLADETAPQMGLCRRIEKQLHALFTFVADPAVPPTNNAAERSLRHLVVSRKISGGTRSKLGTATKLALASLFTTWRLRGLDPLVACRQLLTSPQA